MVLAPMYFVKALYFDIFFLHVEQLTHYNNHPVHQVIRTKY